MYLFDTDTLSNIVKRKPSGRLLEKLKETPKAFQYTSAINVGEYQNKVKQKISIFFGNTPPVRSTPVFKKF